MTTFPRCSDNRKSVDRQHRLFPCLLFVHSHYKSAYFFLSSASLASGPYCQVRDYVRARGRGREWIRACSGTCREHFEDPIIPKRSAGSTGSIKTDHVVRTIHGEDIVIVTRASHDIAPRRSSSIKSTIAIAKYPVDKTPLGVSSCSLQVRRPHSAEKVP